MKSNYQKRSDDWGWFIDIENNSIVQDNYKILKPIYNNKLPKIYNNKLPVIKEDEQEYEDDYDYYKKNYKDPEDIYVDKEVTIFNKETNISNKETKIFYKIKNYLFTFSSRTIITITTAYILLSIFNLSHSS